MSGAPFPGRAARTSVVLAAMILGTVLLCPRNYAQNQPSPHTHNSFPDTDWLLPRVAQHQKYVEEMLNEYTFTDQSTLFTSDKKGQVRGQHTETYYITPTAYEFFTLHVSHDGEPASQTDLQKQESEIEHKIRQYERKAQKPGKVHPKNTLLFADIILKSRFTPLRSDQTTGKRMIVYAFEPKLPPPGHGDLGSRIAGDMKGKMWISPDDAAIVRMEFTSVSALSRGFLGKVKNFDGYIEQQPVHDDIWLPSHQEFVARGRELIKGFRIRQVDELNDYLKASSDVFQHIRARNVDAGEARERSRTR
jgi:hypothetical protein